MSVAGLFHDVAWWYRSIWIELFNLADYARSPNESESGFTGFEPSGTMSLILYV